MRRHLAVALLVVLVGGACSAEEPTATPTTTATSTTTAVPTTTVPESSATVSTLVAELDASTGGVSVDATGNIYVADIGPAPRRTGKRVYRITPEGAVSLLADDEQLRGPSGNTVDKDGTLYQGAYSASAIFRITPDGRVELFAKEGVSGPMGMVVDHEIGGLFAADCSANAVLHISPEGDAAELAESDLFDCPTGLARDEAGNLYVSNFGDGSVLQVTPEGDVRQLAVVPGGNNGHLVYTDGRLYVVGRGAHQIFTVTREGEVSVLAGSGEQGVDDGPAANATFSLPNGIAVGPDGSLYVNQVASAEGSRNFPVAVRVIRLDG